MKMFRTSLICLVALSTVVACEGKKKKKNAPSVAEVPTEVSGPEDTSGPETVSDPVDSAEGKIEEAVQIIEDSRKEVVDVIADETLARHQKLTGAEQALLSGLNAYKTLVAAEAKDQQLLVELEAALAGLKAQRGCTPGKGEADCEADLETKIKSLESKRNSCQTRVKLKYPVELPKAKALLADSITNYKTLLSEGDDTRTEKAISAEQLAEIEAIIK